MTEWAGAPLGLPQSQSATPLHCSHRVRAKSLERRSSLAYDGSPPSLLVQAKVSFVH